MKSSVTSRKQRFWALLLAVVMVVGLLPTAGVKAEKPENPQNFVLCDNEQNSTIKNDDIVYEDDIITNGNIRRELGNQEEYYPEDEKETGIVKVIYRDVDNTQIIKSIIAEGSVYVSGGSLDNYDGKHIVASYASVFGETGKIIGDNVSDRWKVFNVSYNTPGNVEMGDTSVILDALPKYHIKWDITGNLKNGADDTLDDIPDGWPLYFTEGDNAINLSSYIPEKEGYTFKGWSVAVNPDGFSVLGRNNKLKNNEVQMDPSWYLGPQASVPMRNIDGEDIDNKIDNSTYLIVGQDECYDVAHYYYIYLFAQWESNTYDVEFDTAIPTGEAAEGITAIPSVTGIPYHKNNDGQFLFYTQNDQVEEPLLGTPKYGTVNMPAPLPDLAHYTFDGEWHVTNTTEDIEEALIGAVYDPNETVSIVELAAQTGDKSPVKMAPKWTAKDYTVNFDYQADSLTPPPDLANPQSQTKPYTAEDGAEVTSIVSIADTMNQNVEGYIFKGWSVVQQIGENTTIFNADTDMKTLVDAAEAAGVEFITSNVEAKIKDTFTLYGVWEEIPETVTIRFDVQTVDKDIQIENQVVDYGGKVVKPTDPVEKGYVFGGWYTASTCSEREAWNFDDSVYGDRTLYAKWTPVLYTLTFPGPNGPYESLEEDDSKAIDDITNLRLYEEGHCSGFNSTSSSFYKVTFPDVPVKNDEAGTAYDEGFEFLGWSIGDSDILHLAESKVSMKDVVTEFGSDETTIPVKANWKIPSYTVTFDMNDRGDQVPARTVKHGGKVECPYVQDVDHYTVKGWYVIIDGEETPWDFYNNTVEDDITLYAEWGPTAYIVDYDYNAPFETPVFENPPCVHDKYSEDVEVPLPVDNVDTDEYKFLGWSVKKSSNTVYTGAPNMKAVIDAFEKDGEFTDDGIAVLYGVWRQKGKKTYTWLDGDGSTLYTEEVDEDAEAPKLPADKTPAKTDKENDYTFAEWEESENDNGIVYTPKFNSTKKKYTVTFVDENGTTVLKAATEYEYGTKAASIVKPANPTKSGYTFNGWTPAIVDVTDNATYKATYTKINSNPVNPGGNGGGTVISPAPTKYTITWIDGNGNEIYSDEVAEGSTPVYDKAKYGTPTKNPTGYATYSFNNTWSPAITKVTGNQEYVAQFDMFGPEGGQENPTPTVTPTVTPKPTTTPAPAEYDIEYYEELPDGTEVQLKKTNNPDKYTYGVGAEIKYGIDKEGYTFEGWYSKRSKKYVKKVGTKTKGTVKLYAIFVPDDSGNGNEGDNGKGLPTDFSTLFVRLIDYTENSMTLKWEKMEYVDGYDILGSRCNSKDVIRPYEPIVSVDADTDEYVMSDLLAKTYYKFYVRAFILVNGEKRYITTSINVHGVTLNDTYGVADDLEIEKVVAKYINGKSKTKYVRSTAADDGEINITLKVGQSLKIVTSEYNKDGKEIRAHRPISFESSDPAICKIGKKSSHKYGVVVADKANTYKSHTITALAAGECDIYVFAQNGVYKTIHVTVK